MKKFAFIFSLMGFMVAFSAFAASLLQKSYVCQNGMRVDVQYYQVSWGGEIIDLKLSNSKWDGDYQAMGDGFGFSRVEDRSTKIFLNSDLYHVRDSGTISLPEQGNVRCSAN